MDLLLILSDLILISTFASFHRFEKTAHIAVEEMINRNDIYIHINTGINIRCDK